MKGILNFSLFILCLSTLSFLAHAYSFNDNFERLRLNKWYLGETINLPGNTGNWKIDNGALLQDEGDGVLLTIKGREFSNTVASVDIKEKGQSSVSGFLFWFKDSSNWAAALAVPGMGEVVVGENINGEANSTYYPVTTMHDGGDWYNVKAEIDSIQGVVKVYIGGELVATHIMTTQLRTGKLSLESGGAGGWFDNFKITEMSEKDGK